jgi:hypothetical protein
MSDLPPDFYPRSTARIRSLVRVCAHAWAGDRRNNRFNRMGHDLNHYGGAASARVSPYHDFAKTQRLPIFAAGRRAGRKSIFVRYRGNRRRLNLSVEYRVWHRVQTTRTPLQNVRRPASSRQTTL